jgi:phospholipid/cholesterol/gamma-HCH transport system substrate-binding protein
MNVINQSIRVGLFFVFGIIMIWVVREQLDDTIFLQSPSYVLKAPFADLKQIRVSDEVRLAGVRIGFVHDTHLEGDQAIAVLSIEENFKMPNDSTAVIAMSGLLGANYVGIMPGKSETYLKDGDKIQTKESADITSVFNQVSNITKKVDAFLGGSETGGNSSMDSLFDNLNGIINENKVKLSRVLDNLETASNKIASGEGTVGKFINDESAYERFLDMVSEIKKAADNATAMITEARNVVQKVEQGKGALGVLLTDEGIGDKIRSTVNNIEEFSAKLNNDQSTLGRVISSDELYQRASSTINRVQDAVGGIENSGPLTAVGVAAGALF